MRQKSETIDELSDRIDTVEVKQKEGETSVLRALKTLITDLVAYKNGELEEIPASALMGFVFAYLRPRLIVTIAGLGALLFTGAQVYLVYQQNRLISAQTELLDSQSVSNKLDAMASILSGLESGNTRSVELSTAMLAAFQDQSFDVLLVLASEPTNETNDLAVRALVAGRHAHDSDQIGNVLSTVTNLIHSLSGASNDLTTVLVGDVLSGGDTVTRIQNGVESDSEKTALFAKLDRVMAHMTHYVWMVSEKLSACWEVDRRKECDHLVRDFAKYRSQIAETQIYLIETQGREFSNPYSKEFQVQASNFDVPVCRFWHETVWEVSESLCASWRPEAFERLRELNPEAYEKMKKKDPEVFQRYEESLRSNSRE